MFEHKHYEVLADLIRESKDLGDFEIRLVEFLKSDNPRFDRGRFIAKTMKAKRDKALERQVNEIVNP